MDAQQHSDILQYAVFADKVYYGLKNLPESDVRNTSGDGENGVCTVYDAAHLVYDADHPVYDAAHQVYNAAHQVYDAAFQVYDAAHHVYNAAHQVYDAAHQEMIFFASVQNKSQFKYSINQLIIN